MATRTNSTENRVNAAILQDLLDGDYRDSDLHVELGIKYDLGKTHVVELASAFAELLDQVTSAKKKGLENAALKREIDFLRKHQPQLPSAEEFSNWDAKEREAFALLSDETKRKHGLL